MYLRLVMKRFWDKVDKSGDCWQWTAGSIPSGYGAFWFHGKARRAHQVAYELTYGPIPDGIGYHGMCVCHKCDNRGCVRPDHLFLGSHTDNMQDMVNKGRSAIVKGHQHPNSKLCELDAWLIKSLRNIPRKAIARWFDVSISTVDKIRYNIKWRHVNV